MSRWLRKCKFLAFFSSSLFLFLGPSLSLSPFLFRFNVISSMSVWNVRQQDVGFSKNSPIPSICCEACKHLATETQPKHRMTSQAQWHTQHTHIAHMAVLTYATRIYVVELLKETEEKAFNFICSHIYVIDLVDLWPCVCTFVHMCVAQANGIANLHFFFAVYSIFILYFLRFFSLSFIRFFVIV